MKKDVRKITDGAMMVAILGIMIFLNRQTAGMVELMFCWAIPVPLVFYTAKYGFKDGILPYFAMLILTIMLGGLQSVYYFMVYGIVGLVYGSGVKAKWSSKKLLFISISIALASAIITSVLFASFFGYDIVNDTQEIMKIFSDSLNNAGIPIPLNIAQLSLIIYGLSIIMVGFMEGLLIHMLSTILLRRFGFEVTKSKTLLEYNIPKWVGYLALLFVVAGEYFITKPLDVTYLAVVVILYIVSEIFLVVYGYIGVILYAKVKTNTNVTLILIVLTITLFQFMLPFLVFAGFLFITTNWRQNFLRRAQNGQTK